MDSRSHAIMVVICGGCRIVFQRDLVYTDVLIVYKHLCMFQSGGLVGREQDLIIARI